MIHARATLKSIVIGASLMGLAACQHTDVGTPTPHEVSMRNTVQMVRLPYTISPESDATDDLSPKTLAALARFLGSVEAGYGDVIILDGPAASPRRIEAVAGFIHKRGLSYAGVAPAGAEPAKGNITLYVERYRVVTPECGGWKAETNNNQRNNDSAYLGCSTATNLGLMIANPRDLIAGYSSGNSTATAVGALYTPQQPSGPSMTLSFDGLPGMPAAATAAQPANNNGN